MNIVFLCLDINSINLHLKCSYFLLVYISQETGNRLEVDSDKTIFPELNTSVLLINYYDTILILIVFFSYLQSVLISWTKGFKSSGVVGNDVVSLLRKSIKKRGVIEQMMVSKMF